jgi:beat protein, putative
LEVPKSLAKGSTASLRCHFDLEGEQLYSVKWYKDYIEFYRYLPSNEPKAGQNYKLKGVHLDVSECLF